MDDQQSSPARDFRAVLHPHRSLTPRGFVILMSAIGGVSFVTGMAFLAIGAWPVLGFFGLDVALVYLAFKLNYRAGRAYEIIEVTPQRLTLTRVTAAGAEETFEFNPYWARVRLSEKPDGRNDIAISSHGKELAFGRHLNDEERREFAVVLQTALMDARSATPLGAAG
jgi:uncharacterized membrane protein